MKDVTAVNGNYFKQAVEQMNASELFPVKIQLGEELKEATLKVFMTNVEAVPVEKEEEIVPKIVEMYNFIFDDAYQIPEGIFEEEVVVEEVKIEDAVDPSVEAQVEAPVKEKKEKKVKEPKAPKEKKEKVEKEKVPSKFAERKVFLSDMISTGTSTKKQIVEAFVEKFGGPASTPITAITDGKNPKYNRFDKLVAMNGEFVTFAG